MDFTILAINPGSTSTKIAAYKNEKRLFEENIIHKDKDLAKYKKINDQFEMRLDLVLATLEKRKIDLKTLSAAVGRGGMLPPVNSGGYLVNDDMIKRLLKGPISPHASNLGALIAGAVAKPLGIPAYIYDAVSSDELKDIAKITGIPEVTRQSFCHVLNTKAMARKAAAARGKKYEDMNFVIAHLGGGITVSAHEKGKMVDVISDDAGPFSPERSGSVPLFYIVEMCYSGEYNKRELLRKLRGMGGLKAHLGTSDCRKIEKMIEKGDGKAELLYRALAYQIAKGIGELSPTIDGKIDGIILTGGLAHSKMLTDMVINRVSFIAPVEIMPGETEMEALALGALRILRGEEGVSEFVNIIPEQDLTY